jgi:hypothetical protein
MCSVLNARDALILFRVMISQAKEVNTNHVWSEAAYIDQGSYNRFVLPAF